MLKSKRPFLYLIGTTFPFGYQEPFIETELKFISQNFKKIYIVVPEGGNLKTRKIRYKLPDNVEILILDCRANILLKIKALFRFNHPSFHEEVKMIRGPYRLPFSISILRILVGFYAMAISFKNQLEEAIRANGHRSEEVALYTFWFTYATAGIALMKEKDEKYLAVSRTHGWDCFFERSLSNYLPLRTWVIRYINRLCPVTQVGREYLLNKIPGLDPKKIRVHHLGIEKLCEGSGVKFLQGRLRIVTISFIHHVKRIHLLVDALAEIKDMPIEWVQIGNFSTATSWLKDYIDVRLAPNKQFKFSFLGELPVSEVHAYLASHKSDFLVCTSESEGLPVSMMEANCYGIPVISTAVGGVPEIIQDGVNGFLMSPNPSVSEISDTLINASNLSVSRYTDLCEAGKKIYQENYSAERNFIRFTNEELIATESPLMN